MIGDQELERLMAGNGRFVESKQQGCDIGQGRREALAGGQQPYAIILSCADSRVPPEHVFDEGLGDLFVIRVAGNVATPAVMGSIEYAVAQIGTPLLMVLGHSGCGAVAATYDVLTQGEDGLTDGLQALVNEIRPSVESVVDEEKGNAVAIAVAANVEASIEALKQSPIIADALQNGRVRLVGAVYDLASGVVNLL